MFLKKLGLTNAENEISITNVVVLIFVLITAFRTLFGGLTIHSDFINWKIESIDMASCLPLLFSLLNYGHKRLENNKFNIEAKKENT